MLVNTQDQHVLNINTQKVEHCRAIAIAQLVEHWKQNSVVVGSDPTSGIWLLFFFPITYFPAISYHTINFQLFNTINSGTLRYAFVGFADCWFSSIFAELLPCFILLKPLQIFSAACTPRSRVWELLRCSAKQIPTRKCLYSGNSMGISFCQFHGFCA